jgi:tetratricopeptide (TPR) repeat protein
MDKYINGVAEEAKGDYASAILEFQEAVALFPSAGIYYSLAKDYLVLNKIGPALENARAAVQHDSTKIEYLLLLNDIYTASKLSDSSAIVLEKLLAIDSTNTDALFKLAKSYESNKPQQAIDTYNKILKYYGSEWTVLTRIAELYERLGNIQGAIASVEQLNELDPDNPELEKLLIDYYVKGKMFDKAHAKIDEMLLAYPDDKELIESNAQVYIQEGKWDVAAASYKKLLSEKGIDLNSKLKIGYAYYYAGMKDSTILPYAKDLFEKFDSDTTDWNIKLVLGSIALQEKKDSLAIIYFSKATELAPWEIEPWTKLGGTLFDDRRYPEAIQALTTAIDKFPEDFAINLILGYSYAQENDHLKAKPYLAKAVNLNGLDLNALIAYGYTLNKVGQTDMAIAYIKRAIGLSPKNADLMGTLGLIYDEHSMWQDCDSIYSAALQIDTANALINNNYAYSLSKRGIKLESALTMVTAALEKEPDNSSYLDTKGWVYFQMGNYLQARVFIEKALKIGGDKAVILDHLGDVAFKQGNKDEAMKIWQKAFDMDNTLLEIKAKIDRGSL